jgi:hypothetical protein
MLGVWGAYMPLGHRAGAAAGAAGDRPRWAGGLVVGSWRRVSAVMALWLAFGLRVMARDPARAPSAAGRVGMASAGLQRLGQPRCRLAPAPGWCALSFGRLFERSGWR